MALNDSVETHMNGDPAAHDVWFRAKVQEALDDVRPAIPNGEVKAHFATRRTAALSATAKGQGLFPKK